MPRPFALATFLLTALTGPGVASAQTAPPTDAGEVRRLSPEEKERILAQSDERTADAALASALGGGTSREDRAIHGEVGFEIGTGNTVGAFGTAMIPLGDHGAAILQFEDFRSDAGTFRRSRR